MKAAAPVLAAAIEREVLASRREARAASRAWLPKDFAGEVDLGSGDHDRAAAHAAAAAYVASWVALATLHVLQDAEGDEAVSTRIARTVQETRLARIAATETAAAFNDERERAARDLSEHDGATILKVWSAVLDRRVCASCFARDGEMRGPGARFNPPPPVHPNCRCIVEILLVPKPKRLGDIAVDYAAFKEEVADVIRERREEPARHAGAFIRESMGTKRSPVVLTERLRREAHARR